MSSQNIVEIDPIRTVVVDRNAIAVVSEGIQGPAGPGLPIGGIQGQILQKSGPVDFQTAWANDRITEFLRDLNLIHGGAVIPTNLAPSTQDIEFISGRVQPAAGFTDAYTVPAGKKFKLSVFQSINTTAANITLSVPLIKRAGSYYELFQGTSISANAASNGTLIFGHIYYPGDSLAISRSAAGTVTRFAGYLMPENFPHNTFYKLGLSIVDELLFTVPPGKRWILLPEFYNSPGNLLLRIRSATSITVTAHLVPQGGIVELANQLSITPVTTGASTLSPPAILEAGDQIWARSNVDAPAAVIWFNYMETNATP